MKLNASLKNEIESRQFADDLDRETAAKKVRNGQKLLDEDGAVEPISL